MPIEILSAIIDGALSGIVVFLGIFLTELLSRSGARRRRLEECVHAATGSLSVVLAYLNQPTGTPIPEAGYAARAEVIARLNEIRTLTNARTRKGTSINHAVDDLLARVIASFVRYEKGMVLGPNGHRILTTRVLHGLVFSEADAHITQTVEHYVEKGLTEVHTSRN
jgi:hypothetical protein